MEPELEGQFLPPSPPSPYQPSNHNLMGEVPGGDQSFDQGNTLEPEDVDDQVKFRQPGVPISPSSGTDYMDPPTRDEVALPPTHDSDEEEMGYEQMYGTPPPPPPSPSTPRNQKLVPPTDSDSSFDPSDEQSFESSDQFALPTRIDNPIQDVEEPVSTQAPDYPMGVNPALLPENQHSVPGFQQPSTRELMGKGRSEFDYPDRPTMEIPKSADFGSELAKADPDSGQPLGRAEAILRDADTGRDPATGSERRSARADASHRMGVYDPDPGILGWRFAGATWLLFTILLSIPFLNSGVSLITTLGVFGPLAFFGLLLLTGWRWIGLAALGLATLYSMFFGFLGYLLVFDMQTLSVFGDIGQLPPEYGIGMMVIGAAFLFSNSLLLVAAPEVTRATLGSLITLLPAMAAVGFFLFSETKPRLHNPLTSFSPTEFQSDKGRFSFTKPAGWTVYRWEDIRDLSRLGQGLVTEPNFYFVDQDQGLLFKIYIKDAPRRSLAELLSGPSQTPLEVEVSRGFRSTAPEPDTFPFKGTEIMISETIHEGVHESGASLSIIIDRMEVAGKLILLVMTRDVHSVSSLSRAEEELNKFYKDFEFDI